MTKLLPFILLCALSLYAQDIVPPTNVMEGVFTNKHGVVIYPCTNCPPMPSPNHFMIEWSGSLSPNVVSYNIYKSTSLPPVWTLYGSTTIDAFLVDRTNGQQGFYAVEAVNKYKLQSQLP